MNGNGTKLKSGILTLLKKHPEGLSIQEVSSKLNIHRHTATRYISYLEGAGEIVVRKVGATNLIYTRKGNGGLYKSKGSSGFTLLIVLSFVLTVSALAAYSLMTQNDASQDHASFQLLQIVEAQKDKDKNKTQEDKEKEDKNKTKEEKPPENFGGNPVPAQTTGEVPHVREFIVPQEFSDADQEFALPQVDNRKIRESVRAIIRRELPEGVASNFSINNPIAWYKFHYDGEDRELDPLFVTKKREPSILENLLESVGLYKPREKVVVDNVLKKADEKIEKKEEKRKSEKEKVEKTAEEKTKVEKEEEAVKEVEAQEKSKIISASPLIGIAYAQSVLPEAADNKTSVEETEPRLDNRSEKKTKEVRPKREPEEIKKEIMEELGSSGDLRGREAQAEIVSAIEDLTPADIQDIDASYDSESLEVRITVRDRVGTTLRIVDLSNSLGVVNVYRDDGDRERALFTTRSTAFEKIFMNAGDTIVLRGKINFLPMEFFVQLGEEVVYFKSLPFAVVPLEENDDVTDVVVMQRGTKFDIDFRFPVGSIKIVGAIVPSVLDLSNISTEYKDELVKINDTEYRSIIIGLDSSVTDRLKLYDSIEVTKPKVGKLIVCHNYDFARSVCVGRWEDVPVPQDTGLSAFMIIEAYAQTGSEEAAANQPENSSAHETVEVTENIGFSESLFSDLTASNAITGLSAYAFIIPIENVTNVTAGPANITETSLSREFFCDGCSNESVPAELEVGVLVQIENATDGASYNYTEYVPSGWQITDSGGGEVAPLNENFNAISWTGVQEQSGSAFVNYTALVPNDTVDYTFFSEVNDAPTEPANVSAYEVGVSPNITSLKDSFLITESPAFDFEFGTLEKKNTTELIQEISAEIISETTGVNVSETLPQEEPAIEVQIGNWSKPNETIEVHVFDPFGQELGISDEAEIEKLGSGKFKLELPSDRSFRAGVYTIETVLTKDGETFVTQEKFAWGLVSLNTKKSIYRPGETAEMIFVVLDSQGHSVCNANIDALVANPANQTTLLSTSDGSIVRGGECGLYDANYLTSIEGNHTISVSAIAAGINATFSTFFLAQKDFDYDIVRTAQSKIDPVSNPNKFDVKIDVESFVGTGPIVIREYVPDVFGLTTDGAVEQAGGEKVITWNRELDSGSKASVSYSYSVPKVFPQLYALGRADVQKGGSNFTEARNWFVAADPPPQVGLKTVEFFVNQSGGYNYSTNAINLLDTYGGIAGTNFWNSSFTVQLPETGVSVKSAWFEVYGTNLRGQAANIRFHINGTFSPIFVLPAGGEWYSWKIIVNGTNRTTNPNGMLYGISNSNPNSFNFSVQPITAGVEIGAVSVKAVMTYEYDLTSATQLQTDQFFINSSDRQLPANAIWSSNRTISLSGTSPSVKSAWFEVGGMTNGATNMTLSVSDDRFLQYAKNISISKQTSEQESFLVNINATNGTVDVYSIADNNPFRGNISVRCFRDPCNGLYAKLFVTYTTTDKTQTTLEFFANSTSGASSASGVFQNYTFPIQLYGDNPRVQNAFIEIRGGLIGTANTMEVWINGTRLGLYTLDFGTGESAGFNLVFNGTNRTTLPNGNLYGITTNNVSYWNLGIRCIAAACQYLNAKAIITYNYTGDPNVTTAKFLVNASNSQIASNTNFNSTYALNLSGGDPIRVLSAWYDIGGNMGSTTDTIMSASSGVCANNCNMSYDQQTLDSSGASQPSYAFKLALNASNSSLTSLAPERTEGTPYEITANNTVFVYDLRLRPSGGAANVLYSIVGLTYTHQLIPDTPTAGALTVQQVNETLALAHDTAEEKRINIKSVQLTTITELSPRQLLLERLFAQTLSAIDAVFKGIAKIVRDLLTSVNLTTLNILFERANANLATLTDFMQRGLVLFRTNVETTTLADLGNLVKSLQKSAAEALRAADLADAVFGIQRFFAEALRLTDFSAAIAGFQRFVFDTLTLRDLTAALQNLQRTFAETLRLTDLSTAITGFQRSVSEALRLTDFTTLLKNLQRSFSEALRLTDLSVVVSSFQRTVADTLRLTDFSTVVKALQKSLSENLRLTDLSAAIAGFQRSLSESLRLTDLSTTLQNLQRFFAERLSLNEIAAGFQPFQTFQRAVSETLGLTDFTQTLNSFQKFISEALRLTDLTAALQNLQRTFAETLRLTDFSAAILGFQRSVSQTLSLVNFSSVLQNLQRSLAENLRLTDLSTAVAGFQRSFSESLRLIDVSAAIKSFQTSVSEALRLTDFSAAIAGFQRTVSETLNLTSVTELLKSLQISVIEALRLTDFASGVLVFQQFFVSVFERLSLADLTTLVKSLQTSVSETLRLSDLSAVIASFQRTAADALRLTDLSAVIKSLQKSLSETLSLTNLSTAIANFQRSLSESLRLTDFSTALQNLQRLFSERLNLTNISTAIAGFQRSVSNAISLADLGQRLASLARSLSEALNLNQFTQAVASFTRSVSETLRLSDFSTTLQNLQRFFAERLSLTNVSSAIAGFQRTVSETLRLTDFTAIVKSLQASVSEALRITDFARATQALTRLVSDTLRLTDFVGTLRDVQVFVSQTLRISDLTSFTRTIQIFVTDFIQFVMRVTGGAFFNFPEPKTYLVEVADALRLSDFSIAARLFTAQVELLLEFRDAIVSDFFDFIESIVQAITGAIGGGGGGGGGPTVPFPTVPQGKGPIKIASVPVLVGMAADSTDTAEVRVRNAHAAGVSQVRLDIGGVPGEWVAVTPFEQGITAGETDSFLVIFVVPRGAELKDHQVLVTATDGTDSDRSSFVLRLQKARLDSERPAFARGVDLDVDNNRTRVSIRVVGNARDYAQVQIFETIDKSLAQSSDEIEFDLNNRPKVLRRDPQLLYTFSNVKVGEVRDTYYLLRGIPQDLNRLVYWPFEQVMFIADKFPKGFRVVEVPETTFLIGFDSRFTVAIENQDSDSHTMRSYLDVPEGWEVEPDSVNLTFGPLERKSIGFDVMVPQGAAVGKYIMTVNYVWDDTRLAKEVVVNVETLFGVVTIVIISVIVLGAAGGTIWWIRKRGREGRLPTYRRIQELREGLAGRGRFRYRYRQRT